MVPKSYRFPSVLQTSSCTASRQPMIKKTWRNEICVLITEAQRHTRITLFSILLARIQSHDHTQLQMRLGNELPGALESQNREVDRQLAVSTTTRTFYDPINSSLRINPKEIITHIYKDVWQRMFINSIHFNSENNLQVFDVLSYSTSKQWCIYMHM